MRSSLYSSLIAGAACLALVSTGCPSSSAPKPVDKHAHEHDHEHEHAHHGPHGGHIMELGNEEYHAEWDHDDTGKVTVYILDSEMKKDVPIDAESLTIKTAVKSETGETEKSYSLEAVNSSDGKASQFEGSDKTLVSILTGVGEGVTAHLEVPISGKVYTQKFEHDDHDH